MKVVGMLKEVELRCKHSQNQYISSQPKIKQYDEYDARVRCESRLEKAMCHRLQQSA
jgi:hypothetical protein